MKALTISASKNIPTIIDAVDMYRDIVKLEDHLSYKIKIRTENPIEYIDILINFYVENGIISNNLSAMANKLISLLEEYNDNNKKVKEVLDSINKTDKVSLLGTAIPKISSHISFVCSYINLLRNPLEACTSKELETFSNKKAIDAGIMRASRNLHNESFSTLPPILHHSITDIILDGVYSIENDLREMIDNDMITIMIY